MDRGMNNGNNISAEILILGSVVETVEFEISA